MFKKFCFIALLACTCGAPLDVEEVSTPHPEVSTPHPIVEILESSSEHKPDGSYHFLFRGQDGSFREETATLINPGTEEQYLEINGSYSFFDADGKEVIVNYKADNHGFVPEGNNISKQISTSARENSLLPEEEPKETTK